MSATSMLVPLQTLFGWPEAPTVTPLHALGLLGGIPLVVILLIFAVAKGNAALKAAKHGAGPQAGDPVWMGGRAKSIMGGKDDQLTDVVDKQRREIESFPTAEPSEAGTGGASARW